MLKIYQIYYLQDQLKMLDPEFLPYDNRANKNREFAEYHIFETEYRAGHILPEDMTGFFSWKFAQKTRVAGQRFRQFIASNPGYDVYFINPFPMQMKFFHNLWFQGEFYHPGILPLAQSIFRKAGKTIDLAAHKHDASIALYCNYWVGTRKFWDMYMEYSRPIIEVLRNNLSKEEKIQLHSIADHGNNFSFVAFIIERIFTSMLSERNVIRHLAYPHSFADIRRKYGTAGALIYKLFPDNSRALNLIYRALKKRVHSTSPAS